MTIRILEKINQRDARLETDMKYETNMRVHLSILNDASAISQWFRKTTAANGEWGTSYR